MRLTLLILSTLCVLSACDSDSSHSDGHAHDNVSGVREGQWPPAPLNRENEQRFEVGSQRRARRSVIEVARGAVMNNPEVRAELGTRYDSFEATLAESKSGDVASFVFYNYDTDRSIEAVLGGDGAVRVRSQPAAEWQPTENATEVGQAIELARRALENDGIVLDTLQGTAMLTYPAATSPDADTALFYDTRVLYVTFGPGEGEPPLYSARVDLGTELVSDAGTLQ